MDQTFTLLTLNIEQRKHLDRVIPYLSQQRPDIICLQEIFEDTFEKLKPLLNYQGVFTRRLRYRDQVGWEGIAILSRLPIINNQSDLYDQFNEPIPELAHLHVGRPKDRLLSVELDWHGRRITVATTHFTWSAGGQVNHEQRINLQALLKTLASFPDIILTGDFNSPKGKEIYDALARRYRDNLPADLTTTIDPSLHRNGPLQLVIDGLFTTDRYQVKDVKIIDGLSDHVAISATIELAKP